ncbi:hypothetical protein HanIR_Chr03g0129531 [Helianthus annuus]|nr:hypothetical protein HanIR_Chr03g0129531 [Helianthus annuus]
MCTAIVTTKFVCLGIASQTHRLNPCSLVQQPSHPHQPNNQQLTGGKRPLSQQSITDPTKEHN